MSKTKKVNRKRKNPPMPWWKKSWKKVWAKFSWKNALAAVGLIPAMAIVAKTKNENVCVC